MSVQGKQISSEIEELIVQLKMHYDKERREGRFVSTKDPASRTAAALNIGVSTVKRVMARYIQSEEKVITRSIQRPGRPPSTIFKSYQ